MQTLTRFECGEGCHPADALYSELNCELSPADASEVAMVEEYARNTHANTHTDFVIKHWPVATCASLAHPQVLKASRSGEAAAFKGSIGNRKLLWHGSRLTNWVGILSQVEWDSETSDAHQAVSPAPQPNLTSTPRRYDSCSPRPAHCTARGTIGWIHSANYCCASSSNGTAVLVLCDVALGSQYELIGADIKAK
ncbi:MAG: hypothetical protein SGPRY_011678, partial [Prymnesium sp.]